MADDAYDDIRDLEQKYLLYQSDAFYEEHGHKSYNNFKSISYNTSVATPGYSPALRVPGSAIPMICRSRYKNVDLFHNMSSLALSSMIPFAELYLVTLLENGTERLQRVPLGGTKLSRINDASQMTDPSHSVISGAGIEKVRVQKNLIDNNMRLNKSVTSVEIDISLSSISEIYKSRGRRTPKLSDLLEHHTTCVLYYGWSLPTGTPEAGSSVHSGLWRERLKLITQNYDINIADDGSVSLNISLKNLSRSASVLKVLDGLVPEEQLEAARAERERIRAEIRDLESEMDAAEESITSPPAPSGLADRVIDAIGASASGETHANLDVPDEAEVQQIEALRNRIQTLRQGLIPFSGLVYRAFLEHLFESGNVHFVDVKKKLEQREFGIEFSEPPVRYVKSFTTQIGGSAGEAAQEAARRTDDDEEDAPETPPSEPEEEQETPADAEAEALDDVIEETAAFDAGDGLTPIVVEENMHRIHYILLGDVIDTALKVVSNHDDRFVKNLRFALGPISLIDLQAIGGTEGDNNRKDIPLSAIPISVKEFNNFFFNNIINRRRSDITFNNFIGDLFDGIIHSKLSEGGVDKASGFGLATIQTVPRAGETLEQASTAYLPPRPPTMSIEYFSLPSKKGLFSNNSVRGKYNGKVDFARFPRRYRSLPSITSDYIYIGANSLQYEYPFLTNRPFPRQSASRFGIPGLFYGEEKSLVRSLSYKSQMTEDINRFRLQQVLENETQTGNRELIKFYKADISLFGNTHFTVGDHFWLEPKNYPHSRNMRRKLIEKKIIYSYKVNEVTNELTQDDFITTIGESTFIDSNNTHSQENDRRAEAEAAQAEFREREAQIELETQIQAHYENIRRLENRAALIRAIGLPLTPAESLTFEELSEEERERWEYNRSSIEEEALARIESEIESERLALAEITSAEAVSRIEAGQGTTADILTAGVAGALALQEGTDSDGETE